MLIGTGSGKCWIEVGLLYSFMDERGYGLRFRLWKVHFDLVLKK